ERPRTDPYRPAGPGPHGRRHPQGGHPPPGPGPMQGDDEARDHLDGGQQLPDQGRCPGRRPGGGYPGGQADAEPHPAVPPAAGGLDLRELHHRRRLRRGGSPGGDHRPHRRRDGGHDRLCRRRPHHLRHVQVGRPVHYDHGARPLGEDRRTSRHLPPSGRRGPGV
ncbi:MAG: Cyclic pyranopterin monophosphate synthase accessory protein, partial [uncultured Acidimicrobiales bacterium]